VGGFIKVALIISHDFLLNYLEVSRESLIGCQPQRWRWKTTLSTNIAGYLASRGNRVNLLDLDKQKSATHWLTIRPFEHPIIDLLSSAYNPISADWLVIDSPAGLRDKNLERTLKISHQVIVPISPSLFDIQASREFLDVLHH